MRVLVYPALMEIGGSQINAIEIADGIAALGHEVLFFGPSGDLVPMVKELGLEYSPAAVEGAWPSGKNMRRLTALVKDREIDLVHSYEWGPSLDLAFGPHRKFGTPMIITVMSMDIPQFLPRHLPLIAGTAQLAELERANRRQVYLLEPPVDLLSNSPSDPGRSRSRFGIEPGELVVTIVCRMTTHLEKFSGVVATANVLSRLAGVMPVRLLAVGDGPELPALRHLAARINQSAGRDVVVVAGAMLDPRPAYNAADVIVGMGSSALKGMAFSKPLIVQGQRGFWKLLDQTTLPAFLADGWYGDGGDGEPILEGILMTLFKDAGLREKFGRFGRSVVEERFGLGCAIAKQAAIYDEVLNGVHDQRERAVSLRRAAFGVAKYKAEAKADRAWSKSKRILSGGRSRLYHAGPVR